MKERNWSYLAGILDGEGSIYPHTYCVDKARNYWAHQMKITIVGTDERLMKWIVQNFGGVYYTRGKQTVTGRSAFNWMPKGKKNREALLLGVLPYLIVKREQALLALEYERLTGICPDKRIALQKQVRALNLRTSVTTNTSDSEQSEKIESDLTGDGESALQVTAVA